MLCRFFLCTIIIQACFPRFLYAQLLYYIPFTNGDLYFFLAILFGLNFFHQTFYYRMLNGLVRGVGRDGRRVLNGRTFPGGVTLTVSFPYHEILPIIFNFKHFSACTVYTFPHSIFQMARSNARFSDFRHESPEGGDGTRNFYSAW